MRLGLKPEIRWLAKTQQEHSFEVYVSQAPLTQRGNTNGYDEHIQPGEVYPAHSNRR